LKGGASTDASAVDPYLKTAQQISGSGFLLSIVPHTAISAFTEGNVLQVVFLSVLFAFGLHAIGADGEPMLQRIELTKRIVFKIIGYIMWLTPIGPADAQRPRLDGPVSADRRGRERCGRGRF
jgi:aerobic C4-dicarboxylate transport protein